MKEPGNKANMLQMAPEPRFVLSASRATHRQSVERAVDSRHRRQSVERVLDSRHQ